MLDDKPTSRTEVALNVSNKTLEAIASAQEVEALDGGLLEDALALKDRIEGLTIFATNEHFAVKEMADRLEPVILAATNVYYIPAEQWDLNPSSEEKVVDRYGLAAIDLRSRLRDLASRLAAIQNMLEAERIATNLRSEQN